MRDRLQLDIEQHYSQNEAAHYNDTDVWNRGVDRGEVPDRVEQQSVTSADYEIYEISRFGEGWGGLLCANYPCL